MVKTLYHGSCNIIEKPVFEYGKSYNDYGSGFYCTDSLEMAKEWAAGKDQDGYANCYELDCNGLQIRNIAFCIGWQCCCEIGSLMFPPVLRWELRNICLAFLTLIMKHAMP